MLVANMQCLFAPILLVMGAVSIYGEQAPATVPIPQDPKERVAAAGKASGPVTLAPYYLEHVDISPRGERFGLKEIVARRSDGAIVHIGALAPGDMRAFGRDVTFPDGTRVSVYERIQAKTTWPPDEMQMRFFREHLLEGPAECAMGSPPLRREQMEGLDVDVVQFDLGGGARRVRVWAAPKLGCEALYNKVEDRAPDGSFRIDMEVKTTKLVIGEPDARLFEVARDLVEMKPSEVVRKRWSVMEPPVPVEQKDAFLRFDERMAAEQDKRYEAATSRAPH